MKSQSIHCPNCSYRVRAEDINITALVGKCARCDRIFDLPTNEGSSDRGGSSDRNNDLGPEPSCPSNVVQEIGLSGELHIKRRWFHPGLFFLLFFCIAWDGFLVFWYSMALFGVGENGGIEWVAVLFPIGHIAVGVGLTYYVLAGFLNTTRVLIDHTSLIVRHGPIPWIRNRNLPRDQIQGIEFGSTHSQNHQKFYAVCAHHTNGRQITLLSGLNHGQMQYIAYQLAKHLEVRLAK